MKTFSECRASKIPRDAWAHVKVTIPQREEMKKLRARGLTYKEVGEAFGVTASTARDICLDLKYRGRRRAPDKERKKAVRLKSWYRRREIVNAGKGEYTGWTDKRHKSYSVGKWIDPVTEQVYNAPAAGLVPCRVLFEKIRN